MKQSAATERVQKVAVSIILIDHNTRFTEYSFEMALVILNIDPLEVRKYYVKSLSSRHLNLDMLIYLKPIKISIKQDISLSILFCMYGRCRKVPNPTKRDQTRAVSSRAHCLWGTLSPGHIFSRAYFLWEFFPSGAHCLPGHNVSGACCLPGQIVSGAHCLPGHIVFRGTLSPGAYCLPGHIISGAGYLRGTLSWRHIVSWQVVSGAGCLRGRLSPGRFVSGAYYLRGILSPGADCLRGGLSRGGLSRGGLSRGTMSLHHFSGKR